jgi:hypothetical protein
LGALYAVAGVASGALIAKKTRQSGQHAALSIVLSIVLWPLWLPVALASVQARPTLDPALRTSTEAALIEAHESVRDGPLEGLLPRAAIDRIVEEVRRASERHRELQSLLGRGDFDRAAAEERVSALTREGASARTLSSARLHLANVRRLEALCARDQRALDELFELSRALGTQLLLAKFSGSSATGASDIVSEVWARVEVLGSALDPSPASDVLEPV